MMDDVPAEVIEEVGCRTPGFEILAARELQEFFDGLSKEDIPTAYIFRCLHCNQYLACVDET